MTKFSQMIGDKTLTAGVDTLVLSHTVSNLNWLYQPRFWLIERTQHGESYTDFPPVEFKSLLFSPIAPTEPFVINRFQLSGTDSRITEAFTIWGYKDKWELWAKCPVVCRVRALIVSTIEQAYERDPPLP